MRLLRKLKRQLIVKLGTWLYEEQNNIASKTLPKFANSPKDLIIELPRKIVNPERIYIGDNVWLGANSFLMPLIKYPGPSMQHPKNKSDIQHFDSKIVIGNRVTSTGSVQIFAAHQVAIEDDVLLASNIHINDSIHGYQSANIAYKYQKVWVKSSIVIGRGSWVGQNVVILSGAKIGRNAIIGSNSVVLDSIPSKSIAVGSPAKVIKKWVDSRQRWVTC